VERNGKVSCTAWNRNITLNNFMGNCYKQYVLYAAELFFQNSGEHYAGTA
jgi:hypothetical protein